MRHLFITLLFGIAFSYNPYMDYMLCRDLQEKEPSKAESYCLRALEKMPTPTLYVDVVRLEIRLKKHDRALKIANEFKNRYPNMPEPYLLLHSLYMSKKEVEKAIKVLEEGYSKKPHDPIPPFLYSKNKLMKLLKV